MDWHTPVEIGAGIDEHYNITHWLAERLRNCIHQLTRQTGRHLVGGYVCGHCQGWHDGFTRLDTIQIDQVKDSRGDDTLV